MSLTFGNPLPGRAIYTHNYREFLGGCSDWAKNLAASKSAKEYDRQVG